MPHFSRLTDIITCNLSEILTESPHPELTLREIIEEMEEGLSACRRNVRTANSNGDRLRSEIRTYEDQIVDWKQTAREALSADNEDAARDALTRKAEIEDLIAGLRPELDHAAQTTQQMLRIQKALEARHSEAVRKLEQLTGQPFTPPLESETAVLSMAPAATSRAGAVEAELQALKRELGG
jgi:phage shock protein A